MAAVKPMVKKQQATEPKTRPIDPDVAVIESIKAVSTFGPLSILDGHVSSATAVFRREMTFQRLNRLPTSGLVAYLLSRHEETADKHKLAFILAECGDFNLGQSGDCGSLASLRFRPQSKLAVDPRLRKARWRGRDHSHHAQSRQAGHSRTQI